MVFIKYYVFEFFIFSRLLVSANNMANPTTEKHQQNSVRSERQIRPIFNSIIFLLAANLVAKGALGLSTYQTPNMPNNIQGSLYLTLNGPTQRPTSSEPIVSYQPVWLPIQTNIPIANGETTTKRPVLPITQQQIVNILDPFLDNIDRYENEEDIDDVPQQHVVINKFNRIDDKTGQIKVKDKQDRQLKETETEEPNVTEQADQVEEFNSDEVPSKTNISDSDETGRQQVTPTTMMPTTRNMTTPVASTTATPTNATINNATVDYGPSNGNENISITVAPPTANVNTTGNVSQALQPPAGGNNTTTAPPSGNAGGYNYYPNVDYGPYTGNENISITYGPPVYQKPFFSSPEDTFLNSQNQQYYDNYPTTFYNQFPDYYKYNGILNRFYNNYNNPSFYGNYLDKQIF